VPLRPDAWIRVEGTYPQNNFISLLREHVRSTEATKTPVLSWAGLIPRDRLFAGYHLKMRFLHKSTRAVYRSMDLPTCLTVTMHKRIDGAVDFVSDSLTQAASRYHVLSPVVSHLTFEYTARAVINYRPCGHIGIYSKVGSFSCGYVVRRAGDSRLLRFNSGIAEIYGLSGKTSPPRRLQFTPGELSVSLIYNYVPPAHQDIPHLRFNSVRNTGRSLIFDIYA
jgi:hypothetical protein